ANPNELNQDDARYGFRCCHLKNIWTAPLPPETELSRQMTTSTTSIDIMGLQAAYDHGSDKTLQVGYANHFYRSAHKFEQICRHRLRRQNVGYSNFSQPQSHLSFCVLLQYLVERRRVVTQLGKL